MSQKQRVDRLERGVEGDQVADVVCLFWPETTPEERARVKAEARSRLASGRCQSGRLYWRDGTEALAP